VLDQNLHRIGDPTRSQERLEAKTIFHSLGIEEPLGFLLHKAFLQAPIQEKLPLSPQGFSLPAQLRTCLLHHLKVDVRSDVLAAQVEVRVWNHFMAAITEESSMGPVSGVILSPVVAIIHGHNHSEVDASIQILQHLDHTEIDFILATLSPLFEPCSHVLEDTRIRSLTLNLGNFITHRDINLFDLGSSDPDTMHRKGVEKFIGKDDPLDLLREVHTHFHRKVLHTIEDFGIAVLQPFQDVPTQESLSYTQFHQMKGPRLGKQLEVMHEGADQAVSKKPMGVGRRIEVSLGAENGVLGGVVTLAWVVETEVHETFESDLLIFPRKN
jgi:hypothetical protein